MVEYGRGTVQRCGTCTPHGPLLLAMNYSVGFYL
jgi:hypothetical protein